MQRQEMQLWSKCVLTHFAARFQCVAHRIRIPITIRMLRCTLRFNTFVKRLIRAVHLLILLSILPVLLVDFIDSSGRMFRFWCYKYVAIFSMERFSAAYQRTASKDFTWSTIALTKRAAPVGWFPTRIQTKTGEPVQRRTLMLRARVWLLCSCSGFQCPFTVPGATQSSNLMFSFTK